MAAKNPQSGMINVDDQQWTTKLCDLPKITFSTIYNFLVERKVLLQRVSYLESLVDRRAELSGKPDGDSAAKGDENVPIGYTRTLDKAYRFFKDGHVQEIKYHPMPQLYDYVSISSKVLPSMRKDRIYNVIITQQLKFQQHIVVALLVFMATLFCLEHYFHEGLFEDDKKGCTERLQTWNHPQET